ncbi:MAG: YkgJ family cysteine cluster protein [Candidatus Bathyarchaeota archaeon]|nr:YkgJ family cysteine cluster protein [Candidatus Bathyarchaeota archaeon]
MSHEARDILRLYGKLRERVPEEVTEQQLLKALQYTIRTLQFNDLDYPLECTRCGRCCTTSGHITITEPELSAIKHYLKENGIKKRLHVIRDQDTVSFNGIPCPLYDVSIKGCLAYPVRPQVCRDFPREHLRRRAHRTEWPIVSFCNAADELVLQQTLRNLEQPFFSTVHR